MTLSELFGRLTDELPNDMGEHGALVFGEGSPTARVALVGEAPGEKEAQQRQPFVGKAGENLNALLKEAGIDRRELYVTNAVKYRPTRLSPAGRTVNRTPSAREIRWFATWLVEELEIVNPLCVVTLGNVPLRALLGGDGTIGQHHGAFLSWRGRLLYPMYHPASLIYNRSLIDVYREDLARFAIWWASQPHSPDIQQ